MGIARPRGPEAAQPLPDPAQFRRAVALFATGIAILSCEDEAGEPHGMTVNSFTSVSLDPPTLLVSVKPGRTHRLLSRGGRFGASLLDHGQQALATHFASRAPALAAPDWTVRERTPTLAHCLAWFECEIAERIQIHDHTLFIGRVTACGGSPGSPLMYFASRYHQPAIAAA